MKNARKYQKRTCSVLNEFKIPFQSTLQRRKEKNKWNYLRDIFGNMFAKDNKTCIQLRTIWL